MQTGRLVTCILKKAGQREHRLPDQKQQQKEQGNRQEEQGGTALLFKTIEIRQKIQLLCSGTVKRLRREQTKPQNRRI